MLIVSSNYKNMFLASLLLIFPAFAQEGGMLKDLAIPLMEGLEENNDGAMLFDSPEGRIINAEAGGIISGSDIYNYYRVVLPSLGWNVESPATCEENVSFCIRAIRDEESLQLNIMVAGKGSSVTYALAPN